MRNSSQVESKQFSKSLWRLAAGLLLMQGVVWSSPVLAKNDPNTLNYGELYQEIDKGSVSKVEYDPATKVAKVTLADAAAKKQTREVLLLDDNTELFNRLNNKGVDFSVQKSADKNAIFGVLANVLLLVFVITVLSAIVRRSGASSGQALSFADRFLAALPFAPGRRRRNRDRRMFSQCPFPTNRELDVCLRPALFLRKCHTSHSQLAHPS